MLDFGDNLRVQEAEREETDLSRLYCSFCMARDRHCRRGASVDGETVLGAYIGGLGSGKLNATSQLCASLEFIPPGAVCPDRAVLSLEPALPQLMGCGS